MSSIQTYVSWDCGHKTLAWSHVDINLGVFVELSAAVADIRRIIHTHTGADPGSQFTRIVIPTLAAALWTTPEGPTLVEELAAVFARMRQIVRGFIKYRSIGVEDLLGGRPVADVDDVGCTHALYRFLRSDAAPQVGADTPAHVLIEDQPSRVGERTNMRTNMVAHQLTYHFIESAPVLVSPKLKNAVALRDDLTIDVFLAKYSTPYAARKAHSTANFMYLLNTLGHAGVVAGIPRRILHNAADSTMQLLAHLAKNKLYRCAQI